MQNLEGFLTLPEALKSLKQMKNNKTPGIDGFTVEFYKYFWSNLGVYLVRSLNYAYAIQRRSYLLRRNRALLLVYRKKARIRNILKIGALFHFYLSS